MALIDSWVSDNGLMMISSWARDGLGIGDICNKIGISEKTFWQWRNKDERLVKALIVGRELIDYQVENALLKSALGFKIYKTKTVISGKADGNGNRATRIEKTEEEVAPNVQACITWLTNRKPETWKRNRDNIIDLTEEESSITVNIVKHGTNISTFKEDKKAKEQTALRDEDRDPPPEQPAAAAGYEGNEEEEWLNEVEQR